MTSIRYHAVDEKTQAQLVPFVAVCLQGGAKFVGIQGEEPELGIEAHVVFTGPQGSAMMLPISQFSAEAVFQKVLEAAARFAPKHVQAIGRKAAA